MHHTHTHTHTTHTYAHYTHTRTYAHTIIQRQKLHALNAPILTCAESAGWLHWIRAGMSSLGSRSRPIFIQEATVSTAHLFTSMGENR